MSFKRLVRGGSKALQILTIIGLAAAPFSARAEPAYPGDRPVSILVPY